MRKRSFLAIALGLLLVCAARGRAHEVGTTQIFVSLRPDATYEIVLVTQPEALLERLQLLSGRQTISGNRDSRLAALAPTLLEHLDLSFDGISVRPSLTPAFAVVPRTVGSFDDSTEARAAVVLTGAIPPEATSLSWRCKFLYAAYPLTVRSWPAAEPLVQWLQGTEWSAPVELSRGPDIGRGSTGLRYLQLGFTHILPGGIDHMLFVLGLFLLSRRVRDVLLQVSAFTIAHSVTLGLSLYGVVSLPSFVVEPLIALSIAYVAMENVMVCELRGSRLALVFGFGLLHGMGFAGALAETGLPPGQLLTALVGFNSGVEAGQIAVVALAFIAVFPWRQRPGVYRRFITVPASIAIALVGVSWTVSRILS